MNPNMGNAYSEQGGFEIELQDNWRAHSMSYRELALATETH